MTVHLYFLRQMTLYLYCILIYICLFLSFNSMQVHSWNVGCLSNAWRLVDMIAMHVGGWEFTGNFVGECIISVESKIVCQLQFKLTHLPEMLGAFAWSFENMVEIWRCTLLGENLTVRNLMVRVSFSLRLRLFANCKLN